MGVCGYIYVCVRTCACVLVLCKGMVGDGGVLLLKQRQDFDALPRTSMAHGHRFFLSSPVRVK